MKELPSIFSTTKEGESKPKIYTDAFKKRCFVSSMIWVRKAWGNESVLEYSGHIEFMNGDTQGKQQFKATDMPSLLEKMDAFMQSLD